MTNQTSDRLLYRGLDWDFESLHRVYDAIHEIAINELGLDVYRNQIEVINAEQMLDAYAAIGLPLMYRHWSFGKRFAREEMMYRKGAQSLAYELVINSEPCVTYIMEENTMTMQTLVIAHASFGHNHFFKNNHLFRQWTSADSVLDELAYIKNYVAQCENRYGLGAVESLLDSAHALMSHGVNRYARQAQSTHRREQRQRDRWHHRERTYNDLWRTLPGKSSDGDPAAERVTDRMRRSGLEPGEASESEKMQLPEENLLLFIAEYAPKLKAWQREVLKLVSRLAQYFYPQRQTKLMNEGCATFVHYEIMNRLYDRGQIDEGAMLEFLHMHSAVVMQPRFDSRHYSGMNPYALGFSMHRDIVRICEQPDAEDRQWFPEIAGCGDAIAVLRQAWRDYRDESFVLQFLSPRLMRQLRLFSIDDDAGELFVKVREIHNEDGYRQLRRKLASQFDIARQEPEIQITDANLQGSRRLVLTHTVRNGKLLDETMCQRTLQHLASLWGYRVRLREVDHDTGRELADHDAIAMP